MKVELQESNVLSEFPLIIHNFVYNGFCGQDRPGYAKYTAKFIKWTNDPGVIEAECSDGKLRYIPSFAIKDASEHLQSEPDYKKMKEDGTFLYFGYSSSS